VSANAGGKGQAMTDEVKRTEFLAWREELRRVEETCPWPGPRPLSRDDDLRLLVGRERDRKLFNHEVQNHRLILLGGESGVGKSSLLEAGLVPDLHSAGYTVVVCRDWGDVETDDEAFLARAVHAAVDADLQKRMAPDEKLFRELDERFGDSLVVVFDQFEELLRYNRDRKERITRRLLEVHQRCAIRVVLSFRSEYLHELKDIESGATPFGISRYMLDAVEDKYAGRVITTTRTTDEVAIEPAVAKELAERWAAARAHDAGSGVMVTRVGMLHLQAMLYALHAKAEGGIIDRAVLRNMRTAASSQPTLTRGVASDAALFAFGLQEAVSVKLSRCVAAAEQEQRLDKYLIRGTSTVLGRTVEHLSSGGYKLVREAADLAETVMDDGIDACVDALKGGEAYEAVTDVTTSLRRMLSAIADDALRKIDNQAAPPDTGASMSELRAKLAEKADVGWEPGELNWEQVLKQRLGAEADNNPAAGPMRGLPPAEVLIEELRRFAWALVWLKESNLVRITRHGQQSMISLIHDGFGEALLQWSKSYAHGDRAWAVYALVAPSGVSHEWSDPNGGEQDGQRGIQREISGAPDRPAVLTNLCFKGNSIMFARFANTVFVNCDLRGILFLRCSFEGATFVNCQLDGALFSDCTVIGRPASADDVPPEDELDHLVPADPKFNVSGAEELARTFLHYHEDGAGGDSYLISQEAGKPARAVDEPLAESDRWLPWSPAKAGLVAYGSRISALTFRGTRFESDGTVSFRGVTGSGVDLAELSGASLDFHRCLLRHVAFTADKDAAEASLHVEVAYSVMAQWWFGQRFEGSVQERGSRLVHVWNDSAKLSTNFGTSRSIGPIGPDVADASKEIRDAVARTDYRRT
jgi:uncharacterized protein YjbI with pentapeptide repeats